MALEDDVAAARAAAERADARLRTVEQLLARIEARLPSTAVSAAEFARRSGVSELTVRRRIADGKLPARRLGRRWVVDLSALRPPSDAEVAELARGARGK